MAMSDRPKWMPSAGELPEEVSNIVHRLRYEGQTQIPDSLAWRKNRTRLADALESWARSQTTAQDATQGELRRPQMTEDTAWLIEHPHDPRYGRESWYSGKDGFTMDSLQAVRFARKEDALREIDRFPVSMGKSLIAAQHAWLPARECRHGQLARSCELCEAQQEAAHWRKKADDAFEPIRKIADALAQDARYDEAISLLRSCETLLGMDRSAESVLQAWEVRAFLAGEPK